MKNTIYYVLFFCLTFCFTMPDFASESELHVLKKIDTIQYGSNFDRAEVMPSYPGGITKMLKFLSKNLKYPLEAKKKKLEGKVYVKFTIDIDGSVKDPIVLKDEVGDGAAEEAIRLVSTLPSWNPGTQYGKPVKVYYTLPVSFKLK